MNAFDSYLMYREDPICKVFTYAICDTEYMRMRLEVTDKYGGNLDEIEVFLKKTKELIWTHLLLIENTSLYCSNQSENFGWTTRLERINKLKNILMKGLTKTSVLYQKIMKETGQEDKPAQEVYERPKRKLSRSC